MVGHPHLGIDEPQRMVTLEKLPAGLVERDGTAASDRGPLDLFPQRIEGVASGRLELSDDALQRLLKPPGL